MNEQQLNALFDVVKQVVEENGYISIHMPQYDKDFNPKTKEVAEMTVNKLAEVIGADIEHDTKERDGAPGVYDFSLHKNGIRFVHTYLSEEVIQSREKLEGII